MKKLKTHIGSLDEMGARFAKAWHRAEAGGKEHESHITFLDIQSFAKVMTGNRLAVLKTLRLHGPMSVRALALDLKRDYKSVHGDVALLLESGLAGKTASGLIEVSWDSVSAELDLVA